MTTINTRAVQAVSGHCRISSDGYARLGVTSIHSAFLTSRKDADSPFWHKIHSQLSAVPRQQGIATKSATTFIRLWFAAILPAAERHD